MKHSLCSLSVGLYRNRIESEEENYWKASKITWSSMITIYQIGEKQGKSFDKLERKKNLKN